MSELDGDLCELRTLLRTSGLSTRSTPRNWIRRNVNLSNVDNAQQTFLSNMGWLVSSCVSL